MAIFLFITLEKYFDLLYEDVLETLSKMSKNVFVWRLEDNLKKNTELKPWPSLHI